MNLRPVPAPTMAMNPKMVGRCSMYRPQAKRLMPTASTMAPKKIGGKVIRGHVPVRTVQR